MATVNLQFDHAIQKHYQLNSQPSPEQTTIYSGDAIFGYNTNNTFEDYYWLDIYYRITDDVLAYKFSDIPQNRVQLHWSSIDGYSFWSDGNVTHRSNASAYSSVATEKNLDQYIYYDNRDIGEYTPIALERIVLLHNYNDINVGIHRLENAEYIAVSLRPRYEQATSSLIAYDKGIFHNIENTYLTITTEDIPLVANNIYPINVRYILLVNY